ncbi:uncharacterized protein F5Z01DRAFT_690493 [Emericellopsis atlantica]|uniref:Uncharacterized protein n=1 Tax=Emericellopsis atlantica TaxID=2614577 RepID=A0A9P8CMQ8_9HYPO|nr:uncharacterized protein F5Z01DRAFT_690493 [Emericellopsis atlantica]KAG9252703.1 hypothetical protein F5Z01DRAFT_690493 [Emericellopsis atlantica]
MRSRPISLTAALEFCLKKLHMRMQCELGNKYPSLLRCIAAVTAHECIRGPDRDTQQLIIEEAGMLNSSSTSIESFIQYLYTDQIEALKLDNFLEVPLVHVLGKVLDKTPGIKNLWYRDRIVEALVRRLFANYLVREHQKSIWSPSRLDLANVIARPLSGEGNRLPYTSYAGGSRTDLRALHFRSQTSSNIKKKYLSVAIDPDTFPVLFRKTPVT